MRVVVTGANRGIGFEIVKQLVIRGDEVDAVIRKGGEVVYEDPSLVHNRSNSPNLRILMADVTDDAAVRGLAAELGDAAIDMVINNAGVSGGTHQSLRDMSFDEALATYNVDALGPLRVSLALLPHVRRGSVKKLGPVTSGLGSSADNRSGRGYAH